MNQCDRLKNYYRSNTENLSPMNANILIGLLDKIEENVSADSAEMKLPASMVICCADDIRLSPFFREVIIYYLKKVLEGLGIHNYDLDAEDFYRDKRILVTTH